MAICIVWHDPREEGGATRTASTVEPPMADALIGGERRGDEGAAQRAVLENWRNAALRLNPVIDTVGERGSW